MVPCPNPVDQVVLCAMSSNIEHVFVDGRRLVERGRFLHLDEQEIIRTARESQEHIVDKAQWHWPRWTVPAK